MNSNPHGYSQGGQGEQHNETAQRRRDDPVALESRLRNLIISNAHTTAPNDNQFPPLPQSAPPRGGSGAGSSQSLGGGKSQGPSNPSESDIRQPVPSSPKSARRRPNQAQRRQMSAQLSLPIHPRGPPPTLAPASAPYSTHSQGNRYGAAHPLSSHARQHSTAADQYQRHDWPQSASPYGGPPPMPWSSSTSSHSPSDGTFQGAVPPMAGQVGQVGQSYSRPHGRRPNHSVGSVPVLYADTSTPRFHRSQHHPPYHYSRDQPSPDVVLRQAKLLGTLCSEVVSGAEIERDDIADKEAFRVSIEEICQRAISKYEMECNGSQEFPVDSIQLKCFGSLSSGFATKASDMDLGLLSPRSAIPPDSSGSPIPRLVEKAFLDAGLGARLLTRTRVPIIKLCERPPAKLLADLRREREKWENGLDPEAPDARDEDDQDDIDGELSPTLRAVAPQVTMQSENSNEASHPLLPAGDGEAVGHPRQRRALLRQDENQTLSSYYSSAKRTLRRLGGRDLTVSNQKSFSQEDCEILNRVCQAFIEGVHDDTLQQRLKACTALHLNELPDGQASRTLHGVFTQMEGEAMLLQWEKRIVRERSEELERQLATAVRAWAMLRDKPAHGPEAIYYSKDLQGLLDKIKKAPSVQLVLLEQGQFEAVSHYYDRALKIMSEVVPGPDSTPRDLEREVLRRYISGIYYREIRHPVDDFARSHVQTPSFADVVVRHKSLQLALEFERALSHHQYTNSEAKAIESYIALLRGPMAALNTDMDTDTDTDTDTNTTSGAPRLAIPITDEPSIRLLEQIRVLVDPSSLLPNQPRDPYRDRLEFPKAGVGVQCDINFSAHLALQNTLLLRCYSHTDARVRPLVLFVKHWAKVRGINTPYRGTLSSYGYVLMVLHFLVNVARPFVCPNLQQLAYHSQPAPTPGQHLDDGSPLSCRGRDVRFWRDEAEIMELARRGALNKNTELIGNLVRGFFEYYAQTGPMTTVAGRGFDWGREVLSLRTIGGLVTKQEKGWTGAKTVTIVEQTQAHSQAHSQAHPHPHPHAPSDPASTMVQSPPLPVPGQAGREVPARPAHAPQRSCEIKEVRHRYLFAIEDPFETDHNVARTVTHNGIVSIRDEFRRAWRIIQNVGYGRQGGEDLLQGIDLEIKGAQNAFVDLLHELHGGSAMSVAGAAV